jgi:hypothetical protein
MIYVMLLAHLLGDYVFQLDVIARWKARSVAGVLAHGGIVTLTTVICAAMLDASWWPYALLIGAIHTAIDLVRARFLRTSDVRWELIWYLLDQAAHLGVITLVVEVSHAPSWSTTFAAPRAIIYTLGYVILLNPAWVLLRLVVRGVWGTEAAPHLGAGEKYGPMLERVLIASCVLTNHFHLVPLLLLPRRVRPLRVQAQGVEILLYPRGHWAETIIGVSLAVAVGLILRMIGG